MTPIPWGLPFLGGRLVSEEGGSQFSPVGWGNLGGRPVSQEASIVSVAEFSEKSRLP